MSRDLKSFCYSRISGGSVVSYHYSVTTHCIQFPIHSPQVVADDKDLGANGDIYYSLADHNDEFSIDAASGEISTSSRLRGEIGALYRLTVVAHDRGSPNPKSSTGFVEVRTSSAQVASLHFDNSTYTVYIPEHSPVDFDITKVRTPFVNREYGRRKFFWSPTE